MSVKIVAHLCNASVIGTCVVDILGMICVLPHFPIGTVGLYKVGGWRNPIFLFVHECACA